MKFPGVTAVRTPTLALSMVAAFLISCGSTPEAPRSNLPDTAAPTVDEVADATFTGIYDDPVTLENGRWEGEPFVQGAASRPSVFLVPDLRLEGDLDADGHPEAVAFLTESAGGTGMHLYLAALSRVGGRVMQRDAVLVGDRVQIRGLLLDGERIVLDVVQQGPDDASCCPSQMARRTWNLTENRLREDPREITGTFSPAALAGHEWVLRRWSWNEQAAAEPEVTVGFEAGEDGIRVVGQAGCNRYFASIEAGDMPGDVTVGPAGATRMACPEPEMAVETRYLQALAQVKKLGFMDGQLVLTWNDAGAIRTLLFDARPAGED